MSQSLTDAHPLPLSDSGFVMLHGTAYWTDLFVRHFLMEEDCTAQESDDLLFFIRKRHLKDAKKNVPKYEVSNGQNTANSHSLINIRYQ